MQQSSPADSDQLRIGSRLVWAVIAVMAGAVVLT